jgi:hypothetical protein
MGDFPAARAQVALFRGFPARPDLEATLRTPAG